MRLQRSRCAPAAWLATSALMFLCVTYLHAVGRPGGGGMPGGSKGGAAMAGMKGGGKGGGCNKGGGAIGNGMNFMGGQVGGQGRAQGGGAGGQGKGGQAKGGQKGGGQKGGAQKGGGQKAGGQKGGPMFGGQAGGVLPGQGRLCQGMNLFEGMNVRMDGLQFQAGQRVGQGFNMAMRGAAGQGKNEGCGQARGMAGGAAMGAGVVKGKGRLAANLPGMGPGEFACLKNACFNGAGALVGGQVGRGPKNR